MELTGSLLVGSLASGLGLWTHPGLLTFAINVEGPVCRFSSSNGVVLTKKEPVGS